MTQKPISKVHGYGWSRRPEMVGKVSGVWYPDLVGVIPAYPKTAETFYAQKEKARLRMIALNASRKMQPTGVPKGWGRKRLQLLGVREEALAEARKVVDYMEEKGIVETNEHSRVALEYAVAVVQDDKTCTTKDRLAAARLVLDFTKSKPVTKQEVALSTAEDFLRGLADDMK